MFRLTTECRKTLTLIRQFRNYKIPRFQLNSLKIRIKETKGYTDGIWREKYNLLFFTVYTDFDCYFCMC